MRKSETRASNLCQRKSVRTQLAKYSGTSQVNCRPYVVALPAISYPTQGTVAREIASVMIDFSSPCHTGVIRSLGLDLSSLTNTVTPIGTMAHTNRRQCEST